MWPASRYQALLMSVMIILMLPIMIYNFPTSDGRMLITNDNTLENFDKTWLVPQQETNYTFVVYTDKKTYFRGDAIKISFNITAEGVDEVPLAYIVFNLTSNTYQGVVYSGELNVVNGHNYTILTHEDLTPPDREEEVIGNYTLKAAAKIGKTIDPLYNTTTFNIIISNDPFLVLDFSRGTEDAPIRTKPEKTENVTLLIWNAGGSPVYNVSLYFSTSYNGKDWGYSGPPPPLEKFISKLDSNEQYLFNFSFTPFDHGIYKPLFELAGVDKNGNVTPLLRVRKHLYIYSLPTIFVIVNGEGNININSEGRVNITINYSSQYKAYVYLEVINNSNVELIGDYTNITTLEGSIERNIYVNYLGKKEGLGQLTLKFFFINDLNAPLDDDNMVLLSRIDHTVIILPPNPISLQSFVDTYYTHFNTILLFMIVFFFIVYSQRNSLYMFWHKHVKGRTFLPLEVLSFEHDAVIVDGSNVAWDEKTRDGKAKLKNIKIAIKSLKEHGFKKIIVIADAALRYQIDDLKGLDKMIRENKIKLIPARVKADQFIIRLAYDENAMILTNDMFKEYLDEVPWVVKRRIPFTIINEKIYLHPPDKDFTPRKRMEFKEDIEFDDDIDFDDDLDFDDDM